MTLLGTFRLSEAVPDSVATKIREYTSVDMYGGVDIHALEKSNWREVLRTIAAEVSNRLVAPAGVFENEKPTWSRPQADWVAAVLNAGDESHAPSLNPDSERSSSSPGPCQTTVKAGLPMLLPRCPAGHVINPDDELIFSKTMCNLLKHQIAKTGIVTTMDGKELPWKRVRPLVTASILRACFEIA